MAETILIIGGGIAGLTSGCYAQMNGYNTTILEQHTSAGGLCTSWSRGGYVFDYSMSFLMGVAPGSGLNRMWQELGALSGRSIHFFEEFSRVCSDAGQTLIGHTNPDKFERHLIELSPGDAKLIKEFTGAIRTMARHPSEPPAKPPEAMTKLEKFKQIMQYVPLGKVVSRWGSMTTDDFALEFKDPFLRRVMPQLFTWPGVSMYGVIMSLAGLYTRSTGRPSGGARSFADTIARRYAGLGGEVRYQTKVETILVEDGRAVGVRLADGSELRSDIIISTADGRRTIFDMLAGKHVSDEILGFYRDLPFYQPIVQASLGIARDFSQVPVSTVYHADEPLIDAGERPSVVGIKHFCFDPAMAPPGKSTVVVEYSADYDFWRSLYRDPQHYRDEKERVAAAAIALLEARHPGTRDLIEAVDVATPVTAERYTGSFHGSPMGWNLPQNAKTAPIMQSGLTRTLPGLAGFYMAGQWAPAGGVPAVAAYARNVIQLICHEAGSEFVTSVPSRQ